MGSEQGQSGAELAAQQAHSGRWPTLRISGPKLASKTTHQPCFQIKPHLHGVEAELVLGALLGAAQVGGQQHLRGRGAMRQGALTGRVDWQTAAGGAD